MAQADPNAAAPNRIELMWCPPPSGGILGPDARKTPYHHFAIFADGRRVVGGTCSGDEVAARTFILKRAAEKGLNDPPIIMRPPSDR